MHSPITDSPTKAASRGWSWFKAVGIALAAVAWAVGAHIVSAQDRPSDWGAALAVAPVVTAVALALWSVPVGWLGATGALAAVGLLVMSWPWLSARVALLFFFEQIGVYLLLAVVFGRTMLGPQESLVTQMARRVHGGVLTPRQQVYTRRVTLAWTLFFCTLALGSAILFLLAPRVVWSTFANLLGGPLIGLMFIGEFAWRRFALAGEERSSIADAIRAWKAYNAGKAP